jgi:hypothetical protein
MELYIHRGPDGGGFNEQKGTDGEPLSDAACLSFGIPRGGKWGAAPNCYYVGDIQLFLSSFLSSLATLIGFHERNSHHLLFHQ